MHGKNVKFIAIKFPFNEVVEAILCRDHKKNALSKKIDSQKIKLGDFRNSMVPCKNML
jgi:hypothetical protein